MRIVLCGKLSSSMVILLIFPIVSFANNFVSENYLGDITGDGKAIDLNNHPFILKMFTFIMEIIIGGIFLVIFRIRTKPEAKFQEQPRNTFELFELVKSRGSFIKKRSHWSLFGFVLLQMVIDGLTAFCFLISNTETPLNENEFLFNAIIIQIIFNSIVSIPILKYRLHRHHFFSIGLFAVSFILVSLKSLSFFGRIEILYLIASYILWAFLETNAKWIMKEFSVSPFILLFLYGVVGLSYQVLLSFPLSFIPCGMSFCKENEGVFEDYITTLRKIFTTGSLGIMLFVSSILSTGYDLFLLLVNNAFTPTHSCTAESMENVIFWIISLCKMGIIEPGYFCLTLIGYCLLILGGLVYNEILICYLCSLDTFTRTEICKRGRRDSEVSLELEIRDVDEVGLE